MQERVFESGIIYLTSVSGIFFHFILYNISVLQKSPSLKNAICLWNYVFPFEKKKNLK